MSSSSTKLLPVNEELNNPLPPNYELVNGEVVGAETMPDIQKGTSGVTPSAPPAQMDIQQDVRR